MPPPTKPTMWMFADAVEMLARAERLQRQFFAPAGSAEPCWEPPVDILQTAEGLAIEIALPGVEPGAVEAAFVPGGLVVRAERQPPSARRARVLRLELPFGRFERKIPLPPGKYDLVQNDLVNGCLRLVLRKRA
jgi:HSP20 family protein